MKYLKRNILMLPLLMLFSIPIAFYIKGFTWEEAASIGPIFNFSAFILFGCIPTLIIHFSHYRPSKDLKVSIDHQSQKIIIENNGVYEYDLAQVNITEHLALSHKRKVDGKIRIITPWSNYSYLKLKTVDNREFNISSIVLNSNDIPKDIQQKEYTLWPSLKK